MSFAERMPQPVTIAVSAPRAPGTAPLIAESLAALAGDGLSESDLCAPNCHLLLARHGTTPVACLALFDRMDHAEMRHLFVQQGCRGMGLARGLVTEAELLAGEIGLRQVRVAVPAPFAAAQALARSMGYGPDGLAPGDTGGDALVKRLF